MGGDSRPPPNIMDGMYTKLFTGVLGRIYPCSVEEVKHHTQKESRIIDTLEPVLSTHKLIVDQKVIEHDFNTATHPKYSLMHQLTRITRERGALAHDDRLDALAMAVAYWTEHMSRDNNKAAEDIKQVALEKELKKFVNGILGGKPKGINWNGTNQGLNR